MPHWVELDYFGPSASSVILMFAFMLTRMQTEQMLLMYPSKALEKGRRYIVAYRNLTLVLSAFYVLVHVLFVAGWWPAGSTLDSIQSPA